MSTDPIVTAPLSDATLAELDALAARYRSADGLVMQVVGAVGGSAESLIDRLPGAVRERLDGATRRALEFAVDAAGRSRAHVPDTKGWLNTAITTAMGAAGGMGGLPTALAELPVTTTIMLRAIQNVAVAHGFDPDDERTRLDCVQVFAAASPLDEDDAADLVFLSTRVAFTSAGARGLIARVAPRLAGVLGQKLAAQAVPILGAAAGAATNYAFTSYYQEMAQVYFGLRRLARDTDADYATLVSEFREKVRSGPPRRGADTPL
jgi:uncharacterized protein (DUF697 family)